MKCFGSFVVAVVAMVAQLAGFVYHPNPKKITEYITGKTYQHNGMQRRYVITGGPGVGKTTLVDQLGALHGFSVVREAARDVIMDNLARGCTEPWKSASFEISIADLINKREQEIAATAATRVICDRGIIDNCAYSLLCSGQVYDNAAAYAQRVVATGFYEPVVFLIESLGDCVEDAVHTARKETIDDITILNRQIESVYTDLGFTVIRIPKASVDERVQKILAYIHEHEQVATPTLLQRGMAQVRELIAYVRSTCVRLWHALVPG